MSKSPSKARKTDMSAIDTLDDARRCIIAAGGTREWSDTRESWLARAAWRLGITPGRAASIFYRKARQVPAGEYIALLQRAAALDEAANHRRESLETLRRQFLALDSRESRRNQQVRATEGGPASGQAGEPR